MTDIHARPERRRRNHSRDRPAARRLARGRGSRRRGGGRVPARRGRPSRYPDRPHRRGQLGVPRRDRGARPSSPPGSPRRGRADDRHRRHPVRPPRALTPRPCWSPSAGRATAPKASPPLSWPTSSSTTSGISSSPATPTVNWAASTAVAPNSCVVYMPERTNDSGFAMTSSLTSMLLTCLRLLGPATARRR